MPDWVPIPGWLDFVDIALVAGFGWLGIRYFRRTRARAALAGLALLGVIYFVARGLELRLAAALFQGFFAVLVLILIVVFQEDLRRLFEQLGTWRRGSARESTAAEPIDLLVRAVTRLAGTRTGALIVLPGREPLDRHVEGGVGLGGRVSEALLLSIFDASSPGHDGAVIVRGPQLERFATHLPLSANHDLLGSAGTRHAAALGLSERCDAVCVVVSEERGTVSIARDGDLRTLARPEDLGAELEAILGGETEQRSWWRGGAGRDAVLAVAGALALWVVFVAGSDIDEATIPATVEVTNLPVELELESADPAQVDVTVRGLRRDLLLAQRSDVTIRVDAYLARLGRRTFTLSPADVLRVDDLSVVEITPDRVRLSLRTVSVEKSEP